MAVILECPLCGKVIEIPEYNRVTRTDVLLEHLNNCPVVMSLPTHPRVGPPLPKALGIKWPWREHSNPGLAGPVAAAMTALKLAEKPKEKPKPVGLRW